MEYDNDRSHSEDSISDRLAFILIGAGLGAILALLFAPKAGHELRGDIADATRKGMDRSREAAQVFGDKAGEYYETTRERAGELYSTGASRPSAGSTSGQTEAKPRVQAALPGDDDFPEPFGQG